MTDPSETIGTIDQIFDWIQMLAPHEYSRKGSRMVRAVMLDDGAPIGAADALIVGITRDAGTTLVTRNDDFKRVPQLQMSLFASEH